MGSDMVAAYAQHLGIFLLKPGVILPERGGLVGSTTGEVKHVKREHHILVSPVLAQANISLAY
jgi:hypothetical protein